MTSKGKPNKNQAEEFRRAARAAECDENEAAFERRLKAVASAPKSSTDGAPEKAKPSKPKKQPR
jgi:hypothetical protein